MRMGVKGDTVRLGIIGFGGRGMGQTETLLHVHAVFTPNHWIRFAKE